ncbi:MAG: PBP1A family penicillin-binding protein [Patescibacteria group bacterium]
MKPPVACQRAVFNYHFIMKRKKRLWLKISAAALLVFFGLILFILNEVAKIAKELPDPKQFIVGRQISQSTKIYDRSGEVLLYEIYDKEKRTVVPFEEIPDYVKYATVAIEDKNFYNHPAFDWRAMIRALTINLLKGRVVQGGSTITQQLAKNAYLTPERTFKRKIKELILSYWIERYYSKDEILNLYLNQISYGSNAYGIEAAGQIYFAKPAKGLTLAEAALLAGLPKAPTYYSPWGTHTDELMERKNYVLEQMFNSGFIDQEELERAKNYKFQFVSQNIGTIRAPHFVMMVRDYLINKYGEDFIKRGGLKITTTLDWKFQEAAEKIVKEGAERNEKLYKGKNAAMVAQDPKTGQILAMVGSRDYFDIQNEGNFNVAAQGLRQPGSAFKPFAYLAAFKKGYGPETIVFDAPTEFVPNNQKCPALVNFSNQEKECYHPENFDKKYRGPISFRDALPQSINVVAVKALYLAGVEETVKIAGDLGITTLENPWRYGLSLVLGGGEVKLTDLINAYATISQNGIKHNQKIIVKIEDLSGQIIESSSDQAVQAIEPQYAQLLNDVLSDEGARRNFYQNSDLINFGDRQVALKTGTSDDYRDAWTIGYTPYLTVGVWAGNNNQQSMARGTSLSAALPILSAFMKEVFVNFPAETFNNPTIEEKSEKTMLDGEYKNQNGEIHNILYYTDKNNPLGPEPLNPADDHQFNNWETAVQNWLQNQLLMGIKM